jgi:beta-glucuronidase
MRTASKPLFVVLLAASIVGAAVGSDAPKTTASPPVFPVQTLNLDGLWRFRVDPVRIGGKKGWTAADFDDSDWVEVSVPHTWGVMPNYAGYNGIAWYRLAFPLSDDLRGGHFRLQFDAVFYQARVWLNGVELGGHSGGYTPFTFDATQAARVGEQNVLVVQVDNQRARDRIPANLDYGWSFDWWNYGGIVRDVRLVVTGPAYIERQTIVADPDLIDSAAITATVQIAGDTAADLSLRLSIRDETTGDLVWGAANDPALQTTISVAANAQQEIQLSTTLPDPKLWHFDHPHLYTLVAELLDQNGSVLHQTATNFGIRKIEIKDARFYLNGEWVRLVGLTRHADSPEYGLAETATIMAADYDDLKQLNMVFTRPVHYPQHEFILDYCDHNGILLIPEVPAWQLNADQMSSESMRDLEKQQLREMIEYDVNHPSVWAWSLGNEIASETPAGHAFVQEMVGYIKSLDSTRYVGFASNRLGSQPAQDATQYADFVMMNQYFGTWAGPEGALGPALDAIHKAWPDKLVVLSEFGFEPRWNRMWGPQTESLNHQQFYFLTDEELTDQAAIDREREKQLRAQMAVLRERPYIGGAIYWTYQDYRTPTGFEMGIVHMDREHTGAYDVLREEFSPALFESVEFAPSGLTPGQPVQTQVVIRARGPVEQDMPAYTLDGYTLRWELLAGDSATVLTSGEIALPVLAPADRWSGSFEWTVPDDGNFYLRLAVVRPTGFVCVEKTVSAQDSASLE